ncbi:IclR family transcriptional regulator domain-containing protein [Seohaeicola zhoushanensis]|uniref:IclR family transcriptional regulator n=1 Tax=Seohaeicola zhoushanensis TaxID=1569283 RepID=A0A8J3M8J7_9RHOB|nr:helix-turn-helix domain-containing protein [Seohaeicola zhoushanensis]GHF54843.1 IclR family transcriptional regulator [Seohaeicola zhoushanensis]
MTTQDRSTAATFAKGMAVLAAFDGSAPALTLADIARATGQDRAAARRGALTLVQLGFLTQSGRAFALTPKVLTLAAGYLRANHFGHRVQPVLNRHAAQLEAEIVLAAREGTEVLLLAQSTLASGPVSFGFTPGSRLPLLHTSLGRMLLALEPDPGPLAEAAELPRHTERSLGSRAEVLASVAEARAAGFAETDGEFESGIVGYAVPVSAPGAAGLVVGTSMPRGSDGEAALRALRLCAAELRQSGVGVG